MEMRSSEGTTQNHAAVCILLCGLMAICPAGFLHGQERAAATTAKSEAYVVPFSHLDLFWAGTREETLARGNRITAKAIRIATDHPEFRFFLESNNFVANYVETHQGVRELDEFKRLVREGKFEIAPNWADIFLNLPDGEVLARNLLYGTRYARATFGVNPPVFHPGDIPGFPTQLPQMLAQSHIPFMVMSRMGPIDRSLFHWHSPDGSKVLVWNAIRGYDWGIRLKLHGDLATPDLNTVRKELDDARATGARGGGNARSSPILIHWGLDLWAPSDKLVTNVNLLNRDVSAAHFTLATPEEFFKAIVQTPNVATTSGEIPLGWPHVVDGILHLWQLAVPATTTLENAEKFAAINYALGYGDYPQSEFEVLWKRLIESMDHNHDGQGGEIGDLRKMEYSQLAINRGGDILRTMLRNIAEHVQLPVAKSFPIVVFNALGWQRDDLVQAHVTLFGDVSPAAIAEFRKGMRLVDESGAAIPFHVTQTSENISRALDLVFVAQAVPSLGYKTYFLVAAEQSESLPPSARITLDRDKDLKEPRRPLGSDVIENDFYRVTIDKATGRLTIFDKQLNRDVTKDAGIIGVEERGTNNVQREIETGRTIPVIITGTAVEENNPVRTVIKIPGWIADIPIVQRVTLYHGLKRVDVENSLDWREQRLLSIQQLFPVPQSGAEMDYGVAFGANSIKNILPGSGPRAGDEIQREAWEKYRTIQDWIFAGNGEWGVTLAADHQLVKLEDGLIRAMMIRGQRYTSAKIVRGDEVTSIHFPAPGHYVFRYAFTSGSGDWKTQRSYQAGAAFNNALVPVSVLDEISSKSLPPTHSFLSVEGDNLVASALKKAEADSSIVLRVYEVQGRTSESPVIFLGKRGEFRESNLLEEDTTQPDQRLLHFTPFEIKTVKLRCCLRAY